MPNFFSAFTSEVFRPIATLLIPGAIGISSWFLALLWKFGSLRTIVAANHTETTLVILMAMIFAGLLFEDFGSHYESWLGDRANKINELHIQQWYDYLKTAFRADPIGRRYCRALVLNLKFELGSAFAMASAALGTLWLALLGLDCRTVVFIEFVCLFFIAILLFEASETHQVLGKTRAKLLDEIRIVG